MFKTVFFGLSALASLAAAQGLKFTSTPTSVQAGNQYSIKYTSPDTSSPVTITLRNNTQNPSDLGTSMQITSSATGGSYNWEVPESIENGDYALAIDQDGQKENYSGIFSVSGGSGGMKGMSSMMSSMTSTMATMTSATGAPSVMSKISPSKTTSYPYGKAPAGTGSIYGGGMGRNSSYSSPTVPSQTPGSSGSAGSSGSSGSAPSAGSTGGSGTSGGGSSGGSNTAAATTAAATGGAASLGSSMALVIGGVAAFAFLN